MAETQYSGTMRVALTLMSRLPVLFDGGCPMCRRTVRIIRALDWNDRLQFVDATNDEARAFFAPALTEAQVMIEMYVIDERQRVHGGFEGYLQIARVVPLDVAVRPGRTSARVPPAGPRGLQRHRRQSRPSRPMHGRSVCAHRTLATKITEFQPRPGSQGGDPGKMARRQRGRWISV